MKVSMTEGTDLVTKLLQLYSQAVDVHFHSSYHRQEEIRNESAAERQGISINWRGVADYSATALTQCCMAFFTHPHLPEMNTSEQDVACRSLLVDFLSKCTFKRCKTLSQDFPSMSDRTWKVLTQHSIPMCCISIFGCGVAYLLGRDNQAVCTQCSSQSTRRMSTFRIIAAALAGHRVNGLPFSK
jgi:hypothetical protein